MTDTAMESAAIAQANAKALAQPSSMPAVAGGTISGALCAVLIFHINQGFLAMGWQPIPTEIAQEYQLLFTALGGIVAHKFNIE